jgi:hypothetical protein
VTFHCTGNANTPEEFEMKILRCALAIALVYGLGGTARADDFQMVVVDPTYTGTYTINPIVSDSFNFMFTECESPGHLPAGVTYDGCFSGQNETGAPITSLAIEVPFFDNQTVGCSPSTTVTNLFTNISCGENASDTAFLLFFSGGNIPSATGIFTIAESGVDVTTQTFPEVSVVANAPEPGSIWLLVTALLIGGFFFADQRRRMAFHAHA